MGVSRSELKSRVTYNYKTGIFNRLTMRGKSDGSREGGSINSSGYINVMIDGTLYPAHRLAWLYVHGFMPRGQIDHVNGDRTDNRMVNLRDVSRSENAKNLKRYKNNGSGFTGVNWHSAVNKWQAQIQVNGEKMQLGLFDCKLDAIAERIRANNKFGFHKNHGKR